MDDLRLHGLLSGKDYRADLASVIGSPAVGTDPMATLIQMLQTDKNNMASRLVGFGESAVGTESMDSLVAKIPNAPRKRFASGANTSTGTTEFFQYASSGIQHSLFKVSVSGLTFTPSFILLYNNTVFSLYSSVHDGYRTNTVKVFDFYGTTRSTTVLNLKGDVSPASIFNGGFSTPVQSGGISYNWIAFE